MTQQPVPVLQILNAAAHRANENFVNHVATNFIPQTMRWIRLQLGQIPYFQQLRQKQVTSWVRLLCRAATEDSNVSQLLPRFTSLANPPADVMENIEYVVATMQMLLGPLPVTDVSLRKHPTSYLSWLHLVLTDFQAAQGTICTQTFQYAAANWPPHQLHQDQYHCIAQVSKSGTKCMNLHRTAMSKTGCAAVHTVLST